MLSYDWRLRDSEFDCNIIKNGQRCVRISNSVLEKHFVHYSYRWKKVDGVFKKIHVFYI